MELQLSVTRRPSFELLDATTCFALLSSTTVGRIAFVGAAGIQLLPVNYRVIDGFVVLRTSDTGTLAELADHSEEVVFEVDHHAHAAREGWSVVVRGTVTRLSDLEVSASSKLGRLVPWAPGERRLTLAVHPTLVTGRRVTAGSTRVPGARLL